MSEVSHNSVHRQLKTLPGTKLPEHELLCKTQTVLENSLEEVQYDRHTIDVPEELRRRTLSAVERMIAAGRYAR